MAYKSCLLVSEVESLTLGCPPTWPQAVVQGYCLGTPRCSAHTALSCQFWLNKLYPIDKHCYYSRAPHITGSKNEGRPGHPLSQSLMLHLAVGMAWDEAAHCGDPRHSIQDWSTLRTASALRPQGCNRAGSVPEDTYTHPHTPRTEQIQGLFSSGWRMSASLRSPCTRPTSPFLSPCSAVQGHGRRARHSSSVKHLDLNFL